MIFFRILFSPFVLLYAAVVALRNWLYRSSVLPRTSFDLPVICIGNLSAGGTGKTPHTEYMIRTFQEHMNLAVLSRGYRRRTTGYLFATPLSTVHEIGDEPYQIHKKFPHVPMAVSENRVLGIPDLLTDAPQTEVILMDDGFQHLALKASAYILITDYHNRYTRDWLMPIGMLREFRSGARRADLIIISKCPDGLTASEKQEIISEIAPAPHQHVLFSHLRYRTPVSFDGKKELTNLETQIVALSAIANPEPFFTICKKRFRVSKTMTYRDHHQFDSNDAEKIRLAIQDLPGENKALICTEKDIAKLAALEELDLPDNCELYYLPMEVTFNESDAQIIKTMMEQQLLQFRDNDFH